MALLHVLNSAPHDSVFYHSAATMLPAGLFVQVSVGLDLVHQGSLFLRGSAKALTISASLRA